MKSDNATEFTIKLQWTTVMYKTQRYSQNIPEHP